LQGVAAGAAVSAAAPGWAYDPIPPLRVRKIRIDLGLDTPFSLLHVSDSHLCRIDSRSDERVYAFARSRSRRGRELGEHYLNAAFEYAHGHDLKLLHSGDVMEFASAANLEYAERRFKSEDVLACVGNHEYWTDSPTADEAAKPPLLPLLRPVFPHGLPTSPIACGGLSFFVFDNAFGRVSPEVIAAFEKTVALGRPIVLVCHVPFFTSDFRLASGGSVPTLPGGPDWNRDETTVRFLERLKAEPLVRAVLCGHLHDAYDGTLSPTAREYGVGALFAGCAHEICFA